MSQKPRNSQPPSSPEPEAQQTIQPTQSVLKNQTLKFLRGTIGLLEGIVVKLEAEPTPTTTPSWLDKLQAGWSAILAKIRSFLPENLSSKFSDTALTSIIAAIAIISVWTTSTLLSAKPTDVAVAPTPEQSTDLAPTPEQPTDVVPTPEQPTDVVPTLTPEQPIDVVPTPTPEQPTDVPSTSEQPTDVVPTPTPEQPTDLAPSLEQPTDVVPSPEAVPTPTIPTPPELTSPSEPQPVKVLPSPELEPAPTPTVELTPEQTLLAAIEKQVAQISDRFANELIQSIQVSFEGSSLTIKIADNWYNLPPSQQDKLATQMLEQAKELDFTHLDITDPQGTRVARSPVVGKNMVILRRKMLSNSVIAS